MTHEPTAGLCGSAVTAGESLDGSAGTDCSYLKAAVHQNKVLLPVSPSSPVLLAQALAGADQPEITSGSPEGLRVPSRAVGEGSSVPRPGSGLVTRALPAPRLCHRQRHGCVTASTAHASLHSKPRRLWSSPGFSSRRLPAHAGPVCRRFSSPASALPTFPTFQVIGPRV